MLPVVLLPDRLDMLTTMTECVPSNHTGTPEQCPAGLDAAPHTTTAAAGGKELMTQSVKRPSAKRKLSSQGPAATPRADTADHGKRLRLDPDDNEAMRVKKGTQQAEPASTSDGEVKQESSPSQQQEPEQQKAQQGEQGGQENEGPGAVAGPHGKGKSMLQGVFSPLFSAFRGQGASTSAAAAAAAAAATATVSLAAQTETTEPAAPAPTEPAQPENKTPDQTPSKSTAAGPGSHAHHAHAHHPPVPEVPEAAESDVDEPGEEDEEEEEFDPLLFIRSLPPLEQCIPKHRRSLLPSKTRQCKRKTLVLDLDETLVHSTLEPTLAQGGAAAVAADFSFQVHFNNQNHTIHVRRRPHLAQFMAAVAARFEVVVFTASQKVYAEKLLNVIDPKRSLIKHRVFRDSCVIVDGNYLKDLTILGRDLSSTFIVDNSPQAFGFQPDNGIPIESWYDDDEDTELLKLLPFLESLADDGVQDVRPHIAAKFRLKELIMSLGA